MLIVSPNKLNIAKALKNCKAKSWYDLTGRLVIYDNIKTEESAIAYCKKHSLTMKTNYYYVVYPSKNMILDITNKIRGTGIKGWVGTILPKNLFK